jgi:hypothetical protein
LIILSFLDSFVGTNCSRDSRWEFVSFRRPPTNARRRTHRKDQGRNRAWNSQTKQSSNITNILLQSFIDNITFIFVPKTTFFRCDNKASFCAICKTKFILKWQETIFDSTHNFGWRAKWLKKNLYACNYHFCMKTVFGYGLNHLWWLIYKINQFTVHFKPNLIFQTLYQILQKTIFAWKQKTLSKNITRLH